jgi:hypothetical protein
MALPSLGDEPDASADKIGKKIDLPLKDAAGKPIAATLP